MRKFLFVSFRFNTFAGFVSGFHTSKNLGAWQPLFFFSSPRPNVSHLRRPGTVRAQPCCSLQYCLRKGREKKKILQHRVFVFVHSSRYQCRRTGLNFVERTKRWQKVGKREKNHWHWRYFNSLLLSWPLGQGQLGLSDRKLHECFQRCYISSCILLPSSFCTISS